MPKLLIKLTPLEPYFLGGERIFDIIGDENKKDGNKHYFIRSLETPSQSVLFGALRFIGIQNPTDSHELSAEDKVNIGENGYNLARPPEDGFGKIEGISPLYLYSEADGFLIKTPFDHRSGEETYTRFAEYSAPVMTADGERVFPTDYDAKSGIENSWLSLDDKSIHKGLFTGVPQVGIDKKNTDKAFFKKEYKRLRDGFCFAFFAQVKEGFTPHQTKVILGQGSTFGVEWSFDVNEPKFPKELLNPDMAYAQSDIYYEGDIRALYGSCLFVCVQTRDYKIFEKSYRTRSKTGDRVTKLIQAGSVLMPDDAKALEGITGNKHTAVAGFNKIVFGGNVK